MKATASPDLQAGFGRADITPRVGIPMAGFGPYLNRQSSRILAPLYARAAALQWGDQGCLILSLELCGLTRELEHTLRRRLAEATGFPSESILIACTHTHSGPQTVGHIGWGHADDLYLETLPGRVVEAGRAAAESMESVRARFANASCEGIAINRDYDSAYDRSKSVDFYLDREWRPAMPERTDTTCQVISFHAESGLRGVIHSFGCHPVVCCERNTQIHGDFVGLAGQQVEQDHPGATALFLPGALGDVNPSISHRPEEESLRALKRLSARYAESVEAGVADGEPIGDSGLAVHFQKTRFPRVEWSIEEIDQKIRELEAVLHRPGMTDNPLAGGSDNPLDRAGMNMVRLAGLRKLRQRLDRGEAAYSASILQGIRLGDVLLLCAPFEIYQSSKNLIREQTAGDRALVLSLANGAEGYAPDPEMFEKNGYTAEFVPLMKGEPPHQCLHPVLVRELVKIGVLLS